MPFSRNPPLLALVLLVTACASAPDDDFDRSQRGPSAEMEQSLSLIPLQQPLWARYRTTIAALMGDQLRRDPRPVTRVDAMKQIGRKVVVVRNRPVTMEDIAEAAELRYGALDSSQRRIADRLLPGTVPALFSDLPGGGA